MPTRTLPASPSRTLACNSKFVGVVNRHDRLAGYGQVARIHVSIGDHSGRLGLDLRIGQRYLDAIGLFQRPLQLRLGHLIGTDDAVQVFLGHRVLGKHPLVPLVFALTNRQIGLDARCRRLHFAQLGLDFPVIQFAQQSARPRLGRPGSPGSH